jgi:hypothetical protein
MFFYIKNENDAKDLYYLFISLSNDPKNKNLSDKELYYLLQDKYIELYKDKNDFDNHIEFRK